MIGIKCRITNTDLVGALLEEKLLSVGAGDNQVRLLPPLNIEEAVISEAIAALDAACTKLGGRL
jgi:acetylornithine/N-succinyldiaminopimelate aminotransferase